MEQQISISESEWRVMKIVWGRSPQTLPEILDRLKESDCQPLMGMWMRRFPCTRFFSPFVGKTGA